MFPLPKNDKMVTRIWQQNFQIVTLAKFNFKFLLKINIFVQNRLFLQNFPYY